MSTLQFNLVWKRGQVVLYFAVEFSRSEADEFGNVDYQYWLWEAGNEELYATQEGFCGAGVEYEDGDWLTWRVRDLVRTDAIHLITLAERARGIREVAKSQPDNPSVARKIFLGKFSNLRKPLNRENGKVQYWLKAKARPTFRSDGPLASMGSLSLAIASPCPRKLSSLSLPPLRLKSAP